MLPTQDDWIAAGFILTRGKFRAEIFLATFE